MTKSLIIADVIWKEMHSEAVQFSRSSFSCRTRPTSGTRRDHRWMGRHHRKSTQIYLLARILLLPFREILWTFSWLFSLPDYSKLMAPALMCLLAQRARRCWRRLQPCLWRKWKRHCCHPPSPWCALEMVRNKVLVYCLFCLEIFCSYPCTTLRYYLRNHEK